MAKLISFLILSINPSLSGLFRGSFWLEGGGRGEITPCLKLVSIMVETWNLVSKYTHIPSFRKYNFLENI